MSTKTAVPCIFRAWITVNGERRYAKDYGYKAWRIPLSGRRKHKK